MHRRHIQVEEHLKGRLSYRNISCRAPGSQCPVSSLTGTAVVNTSGDVCCDASVFVITRRPHMLAGIADLQRVSTENVYPPVFESQMNPGEAMSKQFGIWHVSETVILHLFIE